MEAANKLLGIAKGQYLRFVEKTTKKATFLPPLKDHQLGRTLRRALCIYSPSLIFYFLLYILVFVFKKYFFCHLGNFSKNAKKVFDSIRTFKLHKIMLFSDF